MRDVTKTVTISYDPDIEDTILEDDKLLLKEFNMFETMLSECGYENNENNDANYFSKWVIRFELSKEDMIEKTSAWMIYISH